MNNKTYKRDFTSRALEAEIDVKRLRVKIVQMQRNLESGADDIGRFQVKNSVRVLWATEDPPAWFVGRVDRVMPASIDVYYMYEPPDTASAHRLRTSIIELCGEDGLEQMDDDSHDKNNLMIINSWTHKLMHGLAI